MSHVIGPITFRGFLIKINTPVNEVQDLVQIDQKKKQGLFIGTSTVFTRTFLQE